MSDFLSLEEAAQRLGVGESQLRQWIKSGLARATRRGGDYQLRVREVERIQQAGVSIPLQLTSSESESVEVAPAKAKALPPRSQNPESFAAEKDRRRRMGRRASDLTLEMMHNEVVKALEVALGPLLPKLDALQQQLQAPPGASEANSTELELQIQELQAQRGHLEQAREDFRQRLEDSERERILVQQELDFLRQEKGAAASVNDQEIEDLRLQNNQLQHDLQVNSQQRLALETELTSLRQTVQQSHSELEGLRQQRNQFELNLETSERQRQQLQRAVEELDSGASELTQQLDEEIRQLRSERNQLRQELEQAQRSAPALLQQLESERTRNREMEDSLQRLREDLQEQRNSSIAMEAERARWSLESLSLKGEIDRLGTLQKQWEAERAEPKEHETEIRHLREQITSLTYQLQMAGPGSSGPSPEESRKALEQLANAQAQMTEKDQLIHQNYAEIGELRSKLDASQRNFYELQQRYERVKEEWSQLAARQLNEYQQQQAQQQAAATPPATQERQKGWGGIFRMRGDS